MCTKLGPNGWAVKRFLILASFCNCIMAFSSIPRVGHLAFEATTKGHIHVAQVTKTKVHAILTECITEMNVEVSYVESGKTEKALNQNSAMQSVAFCPIISDTGSRRFSMTIMFCCCQRFQRN